MIIKSQAYARAGLLGNPTDGYFGKTISDIVKNFGVTVSLYETPELCIEPQYQDLNVFKNIHELVESVSLTGYYGGLRIIKATIKRFYQYLKENTIKFSNKNFTIRYYTSIPRQVGLAGSSAIVTATMKALMSFYNIKIPIEILPTLVLSVERDELGIKAGLQDRVIQCYEGCVYMDFNKEFVNKKGHGKYERLDINLLPRLYIAYKTDLSKISGAMFNDLSSRFERGESTAVDTVNKIAELAQSGKKALIEKNHKLLFDLINENFDLRKKIMNISDSNIEMVETARKCGASAKFTGSGGAIIGMYNDDETLTKLIVNLKKINVRVIKPYIA